MQRIQENKEEMKRVHRKALMLNTKELKVFEGYCKKYKISNKSKFMRESIITAILKKMDEDAPTLFDNTQPNLFSQVY